MCPDQTASACQAGVLAGVADAVLPAVLSLLRSRSREVIKAVLGFVKVRFVQFVTHASAVFILYG